jgi:hypothetical protein
MEQSFLGPIVISLSLSSEQTYLNNGAMNSLAASKKRYSLYHDISHLRGLQAGQA